MHDSVTATDIPTDAAMVAGYINGRWAWSPADWARFPAAVKVRIATSASGPDGHVLDVETGAAAAAEAPEWVTMRRQAGLATPTVYCNLSTWPAVRAAFRAAGVAEPLYWIAHYTGTPDIPAGAIACQYINEPDGDHFDLSAVADHWPGVDPPEDTMSGLTSPWTIDPEHGRAYCAFEAGPVADGGNSLVITRLWVGAAALYGAIPGVHIVFTDDTARGLAVAGGSTVDLLQNRRASWYAPLGASKVTLEWNPATATGLLAPYLVWE